jgi:hypothetical protein
MEQTKTQQAREERYREQLRKCGFRSWTKANDRRYELIMSSNRSDAVTAELEQLQHLADLYLTWKTNDMVGRSLRKVKRLVKKYGLK